MTRATTLQNTEPAETCQNCRAILSGEYCYLCGQRDRNVIRFFPTLIGEAIKGLFAFDSKTYITLWYLFSKPAFLSNEYLSGKRVRYLPPVRLFIIFVLISIFTVSVELFIDSLQQNLSQSDSDENFQLVNSPETQPVDAIATGEIADESSIENDSDELVAGVNAFIDTLRFPLLSAQQNQEFLAVLKAQAENNIPDILEDPRDYINQLLEYLPMLMLLLIPILALTQQIMYLGSGRYFIEHLVLTIHNHSFVFFAFVLNTILDLLVSANILFITWIADLANTLLGLWVLIYLFLSLKFFFQQGYFVTFIKYFVITVFYGACLITGILALMVLGVFTY